MDGQDYRERHVVAGKNGVPWNTYHTTPLAFAPRFGFALDVFGNGKTALRGGFGVFFDRLDGNQVYNMAFNPPIVYAPTASYGQLTSLASTGGLLGPQTISQWTGYTRLPQVRSASFGVQQNIGFGTATKLDPRRADVQKLLALTTAELGALDDAAAAWDRYLKLEPPDQIARRERAYLAAKMGKLEEGIAGLEAYLARHPDDAVGHFELGQATRSVDVTQALGHLDRAVAIDPNYVAARMARGGLYYQEGKPEAAVPDLEFAASREPDNAANLDRQAVALLVREGRAQEASRAAEDGARRLPENREMLLMKATALEFAGRADAAGNLLMEIRNRWPEWRAVWLAHGIILNTHQRYEEARRALATAVELGARSPETYFYLADSDVHCGAPRRDAAEAAVREALKLSAGDPWIQSLAGRIAFARGEYPLAVERQRAAIGLRPQFIEAHQQLAQAYGASGRKQEAEMELEQVRSLRQSGSGGDSPPYLARLFEGRL